MKKWSFIVALILCLIAVGGLAVVFRTDKDSTHTDNSNSSGGSSYGDEVEGIDLNETHLIF